MHGWGAGSFGISWGGGEPRRASFDHDLRAWVSVNQRVYTVFATSPINASYNTRGLSGPFGRNLLWEVAAVRHPQ